MEDPMTPSPMKPKRRGEGAAFEENVDEALEAMLAEDLPLDGHLSFLEGELNDPLSVLEGVDLGEFLTDLGAKEVFPFAFASAFPPDFASVLPTDFESLFFDTFVCALTSIVGTLPESADGLSKRFGSASPNDLEVNSVLFASVLSASLGGIDFLSRFGRPDVTFEGIPVASAALTVSDFVSVADEISRGSALTSSFNFILFW